MVKSAMRNNVLKIVIGVCVLGAVFLMGWAAGANVDIYPRSGGKTSAAVTGEGDQDGRR